MADLNDILTRYFTGKASEEDKQQLNAWRSENEEEFQWLELARQDAGEVKVHKFDREGAWDKLQQQIKTEAPIVPFYRRYLRAVSAAAAVLLLGWAVWALWLNPSQQTVVADNEIRQVELPDGSQVTLNRYAAITFPNSFDPEERRVKLEGEAFFEVDRAEEHPFVVQAGKTRVRVLGTSFNVRESAEEVVVSVASGTVAFGLAATKQAVVLTKGQEANWQGGEILARELEDENYLGWKTGRFVFKETSLSSAIQQLNTYYNDRFQLTPNAGVDCLLNADFPALPADQVAESLKLICELSLERQGGNYIFKEKE